MTGSLAVINLMHHLMWRRLMNQINYGDYRMTAWGRYMVPNR